MNKTCVVIGLLCGVFLISYTSATCGVRGNEMKWMRMRMTVTAYCPCEVCCGDDSPGVTASGHDTTTQPFVFVASDKEHPFGTVFMIPGYNNGNPVVVLDRGDAIKGNRLDVFFRNHTTALGWGVQTLNVYVWK
jgi:peptidoglycan DL-endopeptidase CwlO